MPHSDEAVYRLGDHPVASDAQRHLYEQNRERFMELFDYVWTIPGNSRERSLSLTHLQEALMWLNAHVACNGIYADE